MKMLNGNGKNEILVVARPWRGWFGESNSAKTRLRVYALFSKDEALEIHAEWPQGSKEGLAEAEEVAAQLIYSVKAL